MLAVPLSRRALTLAQAPPPPIGSIAAAVAGLPARELIRSAPRWRIVTVSGWSRSQFWARMPWSVLGPPAGHFCVNARTLPCRGGTFWRLR
jgi:hypothetical protein